MSKYMWYHKIIRIVLIFMILFVKLYPVRFYIRTGTFSLIMLARKIRSGVVWALATDFFPDLIFFHWVARDR